MSAFEKFMWLFVNVNDRIEYSNKWANVKTGNFFPNFFPELPERKFVASVDEFDRELIMFGTKHGNAVIYRSYNPIYTNKELKCNLPTHFIVEEGLQFDYVLAEKDLDQIIKYLRMDKNLEVH